MELHDEESLEARNSKGSLKDDGIETANIVVKRIVDTCIWQESLCQVNLAPHVPFAHTSYDDVLYNNSSCNPANVRVRVSSSQLSSSALSLGFSLVQFLPGG